MEERSNDRRVRRSRKLLKQGLLELLRERHFSEISVRDITDRMDLNRGTFYLHYPDTAALLRSVEEDLLEEVQSLVDAHMPETMADRTLRPVFEPVLDFVLANRETCLALFVSTSGSAFVDRLQQLICRNAASLARVWFPDEEQLAYLLSFLTYGLVGLMKTWFDRDMALPKETLIQAADHLVDGAAEGFLYG